MIRTLTQKPYLLSLLISAALTIWILTGQSEDKPHEETEKGTQKPTVTTVDKIVEVRVRDIHAEPLTREISTTGYTLPNRIVTLRAEIEGSVTRVVAARGARVKAGDVIVYLATLERDLRLKEAQALVNQRESEYNALKGLLSKGYQAKLELDQAATQLESAKVLVRQAQLALGNIAIRAPFDSIVSERMVEEGDFISKAEPIAVLADEDPFLVVGQVTEKERAQLHLGMPVIATLITGDTLQGKISLLGVAADANTRTFRVEIEIPNPSYRLPAGMTTRIQISLETAMAHKISPALLSLDDDGVLGIKAVAENNRVKFYPVEFVKATTEGVWLAGLPRQLRFITVGQGFVRPGEVVKPIPESQAKN